MRKNTNNFVKFHTYTLSIKEPNKFFQVAVQQDNKKNELDKMHAGKY